MTALARFAVLLALFAAALPALGRADTPDIATPQPGAERTLTATVRILPPFVDRKNGQFTGYSIDLWNAIANKQHWKTVFKVAPDVKGQLAAIAAGAADVGVGAISITADRALAFDLSQPIMNSGLQILVRGERARPESTALKTILQLLFSPAILVWIGIAFFLSVIPAHIVWLFERRHNEGIIQDKAYFPGIFQALYWTLSSITASQEATPRQWFARRFALL